MAIFAYAITLYKSKERLFVLLGKIVSKKILNACSHVKFNKFAFKNKPDTFDKAAEIAVPKRLQEIFDNHKYYDKSDKEILTALYQAGENKFNIILNDTESFKRLNFYFCDKEFIKSVHKLSEKELKQTINEIKVLYTKFPKVNYGQGDILETPSSSDIAKLTILKANKPDVYDYLLNLPDKEVVSDFMRAAENLDGSVFETLTISQLRQIIGIGRKFSIDVKTDRELLSKGLLAESKYVESSDSLVKNSELSIALRKFLSRSKITESFTAFRGERDTGMFNSIILDNNLSIKTRFYILTNILKASKFKVHDYTGNYENYFAKKTNLFKYIMSKKVLTLADAMQVAKFGGTAYQNEIIELIKNAKIRDTRFKSLSFDKLMARRWSNMDYGANTGILHEMTVEEGLTGTYSYVTNRQAEFILNNDEKVMTFKDVVYDKVRDMFVVASRVERVN